MYYLYYGYTKIVKHIVSFLPKPFFHNPGHSTGILILISPLSIDTFFSFAVCTDGHRYFSGVYFLSIDLLPVNVNLAEQNLEINFIK